jgi:hypothetical protein
MDVNGNTDNTVAEVIQFLCGFCGHFAFLVGRLNIEVFEAGEFHNLVFLVYLVYLVSLVSYVSLVCLVCLVDC